MKSILIALTLMVGLTGCAQLQDLATRLDEATETPMQRAQKTQAAVLAQNDWRKAPTVTPVQPGEAVADAWLMSKRPHSGIVAAYTDEENKFLNWSKTASEEQVRQAIKDIEQKRITEVNAEKQAAAKADKLRQKEYDRTVASIKVEEAKTRKINAKIMKDNEIVWQKQQAAEAAKQKAHADAIEAAKIERRDHPEIGRKRDMANAKARLAQIQAEEDVYAATHNGRTKDQDTMKNLEQMSDTLQRQQRGGF